jgi:cephalosporin-C deacetylase
MAFFDLSLEQLHQHKPERSEPADFDQFWQKTLDEARRYPINAQFEKQDGPIKTLDVYDVTFSGFNGDRIKGWYMRPAGISDSLPCIVEFIGYGGGRGFPINWLTWPSAGYAHLVMDTRGQGSTWLHGDTPDTGLGANPAYPGYMSQGILDPKTYYYRRVFTDGVRAVEAARSRDDVDSSRIALTGGSQGGGITLAVAGLVDDVTACMPDVPFLCDYRRAVGKTENHPYQEIVQYLATHRTKVEQVFNTLDYFDGVNFSTRIKAKSLFSTAMMDMTCPPSTVFAAYNRVDAPKDIKIYHFNQHEGGAVHHMIEKLDFINTLWG